MFATASTFSNEGVQIFSKFNISENSQMNEQYCIEAKITTTFFKFMMQPVLNAIVSELLYPRLILELLQNPFR